jgi:hypothetical protein
MYGGGGDGDGKENPLTAEFAKNVREDREEGPRNSNDQRRSA